VRGIRRRGGYEEEEEEEEQEQLAEENVYGSGYKRIRTKW
jgi:hypothetical protein